MNKKYSLEEIDTLLGLFMGEDLIAIHRELKTLASNRVMLLNQCCVKVFMLGEERFDEESINSLRDLYGQVEKTGILPLK